jgi:hypothetical protein
MKRVRLSALSSGRLHPSRKIPGTDFCWRLSRSDGHSAAGRIKSMKNSSDPNRNRTRNLPACNAVTQPTPKIQKSLYLHLSAPCGRYVLDDQFLTNSTEQRPSWEADSSLVSQETPRILWKQKEANKALACTYRTHFSCSESLNVHELLRVWLRRRHFISR